MTNNLYAKAYTEVLEIIKYFPQEEYDKIPKEKIDFYKENMDKDYKFKINPEIDLAKQNISKEAGAIIVILFRDYFATEEQKKKIEEILKMNERKSEIEKSKKYKSEDLFKNKSTEKSSSYTEKNLPIEVKKDNFLKRIFEYIKQLLKKNN